MITPNNITAIIKAIASYVSIELVRADTDGDRPEGMFLSYKIIQTDIEPEMSSITEYSKNDTDDSLDRHTSREVNLPVSLTFHGPSKEYHILYGKAREAWEFLESDEGKEVSEANGCFPRPRGKIQDRSAYLEVGYETRLGFDCMFDALETKTETIETIDISKTVSSMQEES